MMDKDIINAGIIGSSILGLGVILSKMYKQPIIKTGVTEEEVAEIVIAAQNQIEESYTKVEEATQTAQEAVAYAQSVESVDATKMAVDEVNKAGSVAEAESNIAATAAIQSVLSAAPPGLYINNVKVDRLAYARGDYAPVYAGWELILEFIFGDKVVKVLNIGGDYWNGAPSGPWQWNVGVQAEKVRVTSKLRLPAANMTRYIPMTFASGEFIRISKSINPALSEVIPGNQYNRYIDKYIHVGESIFELVV